MSLPATLQTLLALAFLTMGCAQKVTVRGSPDVPAVVAELQVSETKNTMPELSWRRLT